MSREYIGSIMDMTVSEHHDAEFKIGLALERLRACEHKTGRAEIAAEQRGAVEATVHEYLRNQAWAEPIIRQAIKEAVREHIREMFEVTRGLA